MRPLRLLLSLTTSLMTITLLLYLIFGSQNEVLQGGAGPVKEKSGFKAMFSFTSPSSLFPPSAIISLTDDNSTFFLARPAAFGPALPSNSLSGPLWIGSGFGDDAMGNSGELGCSDIPGWDGSDDMLSTAAGIEHESNESSKHHDNPLTKQPHGALDVAERSITNDDGTDDHLLPRPSLPRIPKYRIGKTPEHADIESLQQGAEIAGKIVLLKRGGCGFLEKVKWAQNRGGLALIVGDDQRGGALVRMYARGDTSNVTIPAVFTSHTTAHLLSSLLPTGGFFPDSLTAATKSGFTKDTYLGTKLKGKETVSSDQSRQTLQPSSVSFSENQHSSNSQKAGWFSSILAGLGLKTLYDTSTRDVTRRPPITGRLSWASAAKEDADQVKTNTGNTRTEATPNAVDFVIGEQDWRDPTLPAGPSPSQATSRQTSTPDEKMQGGNVKPSSDEYAENHTEKTKGWLTQFLDEKKEPSGLQTVKESDTTSSSVKTSSKNKLNGPHEGLWVTLTPTNMSTSPFFDTLLVLVVSPLVTLTVVYALLLLRSRIRRRRWRAPKSLVERLPVRTYHTISDSSPSATPSASSPTTPLLQHQPSPPISSHSRSRSRNESEMPATSSSVQQDQRTPEEEKRETGLAAWRRKYGGRQKECVVCLEEYVDGVSRVMSLPCGHEFHADCM